jgi:hypothetical protein
MEVLVPAANSTSASSYSSDSTIGTAATTAQSSRMKINDTKAGMENIDKEKINSILLKHSQSNIVRIRKRRYNCI